MAGGQALVCGNTARLNGIPPLFASRTLSSRAVVRQQKKEARELFIASVADSREPLGSDGCPPTPVMQRGSEAHRWAESDR